MVLCWITAQFNYFLIFSYIEFIPGSIFQYTTVATLVEVFGVLAACGLCFKFGSKNATTVSFLLAGVSIFGLFITEEELTLDESKLASYDYISIIISIFSIAIPNAMIYLLSS